MKKRPSVKLPHDVADKDRGVRVSSPSERLEGTEDDQQAALAIAGAVMDEDRDILSALADSAARLDHTQATAPLQMSEGEFARQMRIVRGVARDRCAVLAALAKS